MCAAAAAAIRDLVELLDGLRKAAEEIDVVQVVADNDAEALADVQRAVRLMLMQVCAVCFASAMMRRQ